MEEYFAEGTIPEEHLITALHEAIREDRIFPVLFTSGLANVATDHLLDFLKVYAPVARRARADHRQDRIAAVAVGVRGSGSPDRPKPAPPPRKIADNEPCGLFVFKTMSDPFAGRISFFKVISGVIKNDATARELHPPRPGASLAPLHHAGPQGR